MNERTNNPAAAVAFKQKKIKNEKTATAKRPLIILNKTKKGGKKGKKHFLGNRGRKQTERTAREGTGTRHTMEIAAHGT